MKQHCIRNLDLLSVSVSVASVCCLTALSDIFFTCLKNKHVTTNEKTKYTFIKDAFTEILISRRLITRILAGKQDKTDSSELIKKSVFEVLVSQEQNTFNKIFQLDQMLCCKSCVFPFVYLFGKGPCKINT